LVLYFKTILFFSFLFFVLLNVGSLTDKTRTRFGRRRPWILITGPIAAIANILMWQFWSIESYSWEIVYYLFAYIFLCLSLTCIFIPYSALTMEVTTGFFFVKLTHFNSKNNY